MSRSGVSGFAGPAFAAPSLAVSIAVSIAVWLDIGVMPSSSAWAAESPREAGSSSERGAQVPGSPVAPTSKAFPRIADDEETIYAVQRKAYLVKNKLELTPMFAASFTDRFVRTFAPAASVSYHVAENFALELFGAYFFPSASGLTVEILTDEKLQPEVAKLTQMLWASGAGVQWSPIYGKIQVFGSSLGNFNFYVGAGASVGMTRVRCSPTAELDPNRGFDPPVCPQSDEDVEPGELNEVYQPNTFRFMGVLSGGIRFYFSNAIGLKLEVKDYVFPARVYQPPSSSGPRSGQEFTDAIRNNVFVQLGVSFLIGGEEN